MANQRNGTIYIGVTSDLVKRVWEHREGVIGGFTKKYECKLLVWHQAFDSLDAARHRELQMKEWRRAWKLKRIEEANPDWDDLYPTLFTQFPGEGRGPAARAEQLDPGLRRGT